MIQTGATTRATLQNPPEPILLNNTQPEVTLIRGRLLWLLFDLPTTVSPASETFGAGLGGRHWQQRRHTGIGIGRRRRGLHHLLPPPPKTSPSALTFHTTLNFAQHSMPIIS